VIVLGAGFSRAVSDKMPLTDELGTRAVQIAGVDSPGPFINGRFEAWLSSLAEPQPYLREADNTANLAKFQRLTDAMHTVLTGAQRDALDQGLPEWLSRFAAAIHATRATVISLNYDLLMETAFQERALQDFEIPGENGQIGWVDFIADTPPWPSQPSRWAGPIRETARLLKLQLVLGTS
jgi:hypothetical protein